MKKIVFVIGSLRKDSFNRKVADFVVIDKNFNIVAIVELDDSSHKGQEDNDAERDALVNEAGTSVLIEYGFITNPNDMDKLYANLDKVCSFIADTLIVYEDKII